MTTTTINSEALASSSNASDYRKAGGDVHSCENQNILRDFVGKNVVYCVSCLISDLAKWDGNDEYETILDLCSPVQDWESALSEASETDADWCDVANALDVSIPEGTSESVALAAIRLAYESGDITAQEACEEARIDPQEREIYEHWIVDSWFAKRLEEHGEKIGKVHGLTVWGRPTTGQAILLDYVIAEIAAKQGILQGQKYDWSRKN